MNIAALIILIVVGGVILWGALTGWTFSGIFGDAEEDSPPGPISNVQVGVATGESGGRRESYTTYQQMEGLSITISFNTPKSFGRGDLALKDYVISMGITNNQSRGDLLAVIVIPRNNATGALLITSTKDKIASGGIALSGDFNALDTQVKITLSSPLWEDGEIIIREGGVFMGIDYTPMEMSKDYEWPGDQSFNDPAGGDTRRFIPDETVGVTLIGAVEDDTGFIVDPDVTESVNQQLDIAVEKFDTQNDVEGKIDIGKHVGKSSRFLISPFNRQDIFLGFQSKDGKGIKAAILGGPMVDSVLNACRELPNATSDPINGKINLDASSVSSPEFWGQESNWFNFAIMEERQGGWVRLGLVSNFEKKGNWGEVITIKRAQFPVIHPVHQYQSNDRQLSFHPSADDGDHARTYFKFVSPLDSSGDQGGKKFSLVIRRVNRNNIDNGLSPELSANDRFLVLKKVGTYALYIVAEKLKDIDNLSAAVFTKRNPDSGPVDLDCDPIVRAYDPVQEDGDNTLTFKNSCDATDYVGAEIGFGLSGCQLAPAIQALCDGTPGCIGYRTYESSGCSGLLMETEPVCKRYSGQVYGDIGGKTLDASSGKLVDGPHKFYMNGLCIGDSDARFEKWGPDPIHPVGGGCNDDVDVHKAACSANPECVGFQFRTDGDRKNSCSHFLRKKHTYTADQMGRDREGYDLGDPTTGGTLQDCEKLCNDRPGCVGFSYEATGNKFCYPKQSGVEGQDLTESSFTYYHRD